MWFIAILIMFGYTFATLVGYAIFGAHLYPPGPSANGLLAILLVVPGAYHAAKYHRWPVLSLLFGSLTTMLIIMAAYNPQRGTTWGILPDPFDPANKYEITTDICVFVLITGYMARFAGSYRWHLMSKAKPDPRQICSGCQYNLTGNVSGICPECGLPIPKIVESRPPE